MLTLNRIASGLLLAAAAMAAGCDTSGTAPNVAGDAPRSAAGEATDPAVPFVAGYDRGYRLAREQGKPMLVFFTAGWCNFCNQMVAETFADAQVIEWSGRFVCIEVDADAEPDICRQFRVQGYPTIQFLSPRGVPLNRVVGRRPADQLVSQMQAALGATASRTLPTVTR